jgi:transcriptional regulator with XRE-family HTH domain
MWQRECRHIWHTAPGVRFDLRKYVAVSGAPTVRQRRLGAELRRLRAERTGDEVAEALGWSPSKISRYELARSGPNVAEVGKLLDYYGVTGSHREQVLALAREATQKGWWEAYSDALPEELIALIALEDEATSSWIWQVEVIPGLLQTEDYARQVISAAYQIGIPFLPSQIEQRVEVRLRRQRILTRDNPMEFSVVLDESALLRRNTDTQVMRGQLVRLAEVSELPNVTLRVFPLQALHPVTTSSFVLLRFGRTRDTELNDVVSTEQLQSNLHFEGEADTHQYRLAFQALSSAALNPEQSRELIIRTSQQVWA